MATNNAAFLFHIQGNPRYFNDMVNSVRQSALVAATHMLTAHNTISTDLAVKSLFQRGSSLKSST